MDDENKLSFNDLGGRKILEQVSKIFYDKVYEHPWLGLYFQEVDQEVIEAQQVDFMSAALGGPKVYLGKLPIPAHKHILITEEIFDLREKLLHEALQEANACSQLIERWQKIDNAFKSKLIKKNLTECEKRFNSDEIIFFPEPKNNKAA